MKKSILLSAAIGLSMAMLAGCGQKYGYEDAEYYTLNKCEASSEELVEVGVGGPWSYDDEFSTKKEEMCLDHEDDGFIFIYNQAYDPLYTYASAYVSEERVNASDTGYLESIGYTNCDYDFEVIGSAFDGSDLILATESYTYDDGDSSYDMEDVYLILEYNDGGYIEFLTIDFFGMDVDDWSNEDFEELARNLFGK